MILADTFHTLAYAVEELFARVRNLLGDVKDVLMRDLYSDS
jgi:hypothetical protein